MSTDTISSMDVCYLYESTMTGYQFKAGQINKTGLLIPGVLSPSVPGKLSVPA